MPTIQDPKLNPREEKWGILYDPDDGFCLYDKGEINSPLRYFTQGTEVDASVSDLAVSEQFNWCGIQIKKKAVILLDSSRPGPVYEIINEAVKKLFFDPNNNGRNEQDIKIQLRADRRPYFTSDYK